MSKAGSGFDVCGGCHKLYKRLSTHISQNASCANHYTNRVDKTSSVATAQNSCPTTNDSQLFSSAFNQRRSSSSGRKAPANKKEQLNEVPSNNDDEEFPPFDDQTAASNIDDDHLESKTNLMKVCCICTRNFFCYDRIRLASNDFLERRKSKSS